MKVFIANRGEIALRVVRACRELGYESVAAAAKFEAQAPHAMLADAAVELPNPRGFLDINLMIQLAKSRGCTAIHPGYGFLSENPAFGRACRDAGLRFVGPPPEAAEAMGIKTVAREKAIECGVPVPPGSGGRAVASVDEALSLAGKVGYPVLIKAAGGGGGRGIRLAEDAASLRKGWDEASKEAHAAFGNGDLYVEKFFRKSRHIEIQVLADDHGNVVYLGERECSLQRRRQKLVEEGPSPVATPDLRRNLGDAAVRIARSVGYRNAGTVEFLVDDGLNFYFLEMNARLQVEHPVTEMITGIDLVREQLLVAAGERLSFSQEDIQLRGHAIECRINAEDPDANFKPSPGRVTKVVFPNGPWTRFDSYLSADGMVPPVYDSLVGKLIVWAPTRTQALARAQRALGELQIDGIKTTKPLFQRLLKDPDVVAANFDTNFMDGWLARQAVERVDVPEKELTC